jgi:hypothetical protein
MPFLPGTLRLVPAYKANDSLPFTNRITHLASKYHANTGPRANAKPIRDVRETPDRPKTLVNACFNCSDVIFFLKKAMT